MGMRRTSYLPGDTSGFLCALWGWYQVVLRCLGLCHSVVLVSCIWVKATCSYRACFHLSVHLPGVLLPQCVSFLLQRMSVGPPAMQPGPGNSSGHPGCPLGCGTTAAQTMTTGWWPTRGDPTPSHQVWQCTRVGQPCPAVPIPPIGIGWSGRGGGVGHLSHQEASSAPWARLKLWG